MKTFDLIVNERGKVTPKAMGSLDPSKPILERQIGDVIYRWQRGNAKKIYYFLNRMEIFHGNRDMIGDELR